MTNLNITASKNYSSDALHDITSITFTNDVTPSTATFSSLQFDDIQISSHVAIDGSMAPSILVVFGSSLDASGWNLVDWSYDDSIHLRGESGNDTITGSPENDIIQGKSGSDTLDGHLGLDTL